MVDLVNCPTNLSFFDIPSLYYYINLRSSKTCCFFSGDICIFFGISINFSYVCESVSELIPNEFFVILLVILLPIKSPVVSAVFWIALFEAVLCGYVADF